MVCPKKGNQTTFLFVSHLTSIDLHSTFGSLRKILVINHLITGSSKPLEKRKEKMMVAQAKLSQPLLASSQNNTVICFLGVLKLSLWPLLEELLGSLNLKSHVLTLRHK